MIRLKSVEFVEWEGTSQEWSIEGLVLRERNLLVGKNASGKSRTLNIISVLALILSGQKKPPLSGKYSIEYDYDDKVIKYHLRYVDDQVIKETFSVDNVILINRGDGGEGEIFAEEENKNIRFQTPMNEVAAVARRDTIQHKFLEPLHTWGSSLYHYQFGSTLGKDHLTVLVGNQAGKVNDKDSNAVIALYNQAIKEFKDDFKQAVIKDMGIVGYSLEDLGVAPPFSIRVISGPPGSLVCLFVKEKDLPGITDQHSMSQGMFRALSLLIQINYSQMANKSACILIDDIGEGLDFERSCLLLDLLREKSKISNTQLILSTNDRFVMNTVPLEEWSLLQRRGNHVKVLNDFNSKKLFEDFKFTGLSNFSFLEMDFANVTQIVEK